MTPRKVDEFYADLYWSFVYNKHGEFNRKWLQND